MNEAEEAAKITQRNLEKKAIRDRDYLNEKFNEQVSTSIDYSTTMSLCTTTFDRSSLSYGTFYVYWR